MSQPLKQKLSDLYTGGSAGARRFRFALLAFDALTIVYFIVTAPMIQTHTMELLAFALGVIIMLDFAARLWVTEDRRAMLKQIYTLADIIVIVSLLISPFIHANIAFLRILRGLRLIHSYHLLQDLRQTSRFFNKHEEALIAAVNLFVFVFFTTSIVFALFVDKTTGVQGYVDALYFTVTTLTTTGYGDITPTTTGGKLLSVAIMVIGVALFVQLARAIIQPTKVHHACATCGLLKHDPDAVHCKHCGATLRIETSGYN